MKLLERAAESTCLDMMMLEKTCTCLLKDV